jgi:cytochrome d ubiquinol oxidase subunit I
VGRQPFVVYNVIRTAEAVSPVKSTPVALSLLAFILTYGFIFGAGAYYIIRIIAKGPILAKEETYGTHGVKKPPLVTDLKGGTGDQDV